MAFTPLSNGVATALSGILVSPGRLIDVSRLETDDDIDDIRLHGFDVDKNKKNNHQQKDRTLKYSILIVIISAIIFVTIISIYDVLRLVLNNYFAKKALDDPNSNNDPKDVERTLIANRNQLYSNLTFSGLCIGLSVVVISILIFIFHLV